MEVENAEEEHEPTSTKLLSVRRTIRDKFVLYNSYQNMTPMTAGSNLKLPSTKSREIRVTRSRNVAHSFSSHRERTNRHKKSEAGEESPSQRGGVLFTQENFRKNTRLIALKKESFMQTIHHSRQYIRYQFGKSGGTLSPEKQLFAEVLDKQAEQVVQHSEGGIAALVEEDFVNLLNYCIDLRLLQEFSLTLLYLAGTLFSLGAYKQAIFYYNQSRISSISQMNYPILIDSLIGLGKCCSRVSQHASGILFLKKALEYTWHIGDREKELIIYDEIGYKYYMMGQIKQAQFYHERHGTGGFQRDTSAVKAMVRAKVRAEEAKNIRNRITQIDRLFLAELSIPIKDLGELPGLTAESLRSTITNTLSKLFDPYGQPQKQLGRILEEREFDEQMPEPRYQQNEQHLKRLEENKKVYPELDFQLNRWLMTYSKKLNRYKAPKQEGSLFRPKRTLQNAIDQRLKAAPLSESWYRDIVERILREHSSNLSSLRNQVLVREDRQRSKLPQRYYSLLFNSYYIEVLFC